jgi:hypothetical protein
MLNISLIPLQYWPMSLHKTAGIQAITPATILATVNEFSSSDFMVAE